ncbi:MAG: hypothetical protein ABR529_07040 [Actinomycetota bacterium]
MLAAAIGGALLLPVPAAADVSTESPADQVLVVTANLQEAYSDKDVRDATDVDVFLRRASSLLPYAPDVLLLQEVRHRSAAYVARGLTARTGSHYSVIVDPGVDPWHKARKKIVKKETAIVVNTDTMQPLGGGFLKTSYPRSESVDGRKPELKNNAYALVQERASGLRVPLVSVHLSRWENFRSKSSSDARRKTWTTKIASFLASKYPVAYARTFGGDFNSARCSSTVGGCRPTPFWNTATNATLAFRDAVQTIAPDPGVDYVFTRGGIYDAGSDRAYDSKSTGNDSARFYSDHKFRWSVIGADITAPTKPSGLDGSEQDPDVSLSWSSSSDNRSGVAGYEVWRARLNADFRLQAVTEGTSYRDDETWNGGNFRYYVVALDAAHNRSPRSTVFEIKT